MRLELKDFQEIGVRSLCAEADYAASEIRGSGKPQAIVLSAPTGAGKTMMAAAFIERIVNGDETRAPDPQATFLWITDQPELNIQTSHKLLAGSSLRADQLVTIEAGSFDQPLLDAGKVYFLNTQKLGRNSSLVDADNERRSHTMWQTIANTRAARPASFYVAIDEAHRGMKENGKREEANSIVQKLIKGSGADALDPIPMILGISATPERFNKLLEGTARTHRQVIVAPKDVRGSGLLKDAITLFHPEEDQPSDFTLLASAAERLADYATRWDAYARDARTAAVAPILVVQVQDGTARKLTRTDLGEALRTIERVLGPLAPSQVGHAFQEEGVIDVDGYAIRHVAPSSIQEDTALRVVFFKLALTTGWDCPRAEVMMSFRVAQDATHIAQLVGRMVRTPLARQVGGSDLLSSVSLFLPYYDEAALTAVIDRLSTADPDNGLPGSRVQRGSNLVLLQRDPALAECFEAARGRPIYKLEKISRQSAVRRLLKLGRRLAWDRIDADALARYERLLVAQIDAARERRAADADFQRRFDESGRIDVRSVELQLAEMTISAEQRARLRVTDANIEQAFEDAGRRLGGGLHLAWVKHRVANGESRPLPVLKRELFALLQDESVREEVDALAERTCRAELQRHAAAIAAQSDESRHEYRRIGRQGKAPVPEPWELPDEIEGTKDGAPYGRHVYVAQDGSFTTPLKGWERRLLEAELAREDVAGWLRNDARKPWAFSIPYELGGESHPVYPDFVFFRRQGGAVVCDLLDPHGYHLADAAAKAAGIARFAHDHGAEFGRIELVAEVGGTLRRIDLQNLDVRTKVRMLTTADQLKRLYESS